MTFYKPVTIESYPGRSSKENFYTREIIHFGDLNTIETANENSIAILGYCCDEGVRRNQGRVGAKDGPDAIRKQFGKLANHFHHTIFDFGNLICHGDNLEDIQAELGSVVEQLIAKKYKTIVLGGGHDIAFGHYKGLVKAFPNQSIGIINFDAHLDLRKPNPKGNSGTPFYQIAEMSNGKIAYLPIGIRQESNHRGLLQTANELGIEIISMEQCEMHLLDMICQKIQDFVKQVDHVYITIDLDGFSSAFAPGVSAPHPIGLQPSFVLECLSEIFNTGKVISIDIAEMNPKYDVDNPTAKLAASFIYKLIHWW